MSRKIIAGGAILAVLVAAGGGGLYAYAQREAATEVQAMLDRAVERGVYSEADFESLELGLDGRVTLRQVRLAQEVSLDEGHSQPFEVILEEVLVRDYDLENDFPHRVSLLINGVSLPHGLPFPQDAGANPAGQYLASLMDGDRLPLVIDYHYDYQPEAADRTESRFGLALENAADAHLQATLENLPLAEMAAASADDDAQVAQMRALAFVSEASLPQASLAVTDRGIVDGMLKVGAQRGNQSPEAYRENLLAQISSLQFLVPQSLQPFATKASTALASFLEGGKTLRISVEPSFGGNIPQLQTALIGAFFAQDFGTIVDLLKLEVVTEDSSPASAASTTGG